MEEESVVGKKLMKQQSKDPFEAAFEEQDDEDDDADAVAVAVAPSHEDHDPDRDREPIPSSSSMATPIVAPPPPMITMKKKREDDEEEEEENMEVELDKFPSASDPHKMAKMQAILSQFSDQQMSRYESFRRAGFQKSNMKRVPSSSSSSSFFVYKL